MKRPAIAALLATAAVLAAAPGAQASFAPAFRITLDPPAAGAAPALTATVFQSASDTAAKRFSMLFPQGFAIKAPSGVDSCSQADQGTASCPRSTEIGSLEATLADGGKLAGTLHLAEAQSGVGLLIILRGSGEMAGRTIPGVAGARPNGAAAITFDGLPERTLTNATVRVIGGERGLVRAPSACGRQVIEGRLTSHAGELAIGRSAVELAGCTMLSVSRVRLSRSRLRAARRSAITLSWEQAQATSGTRIALERRVKSGWRRAGSFAAAGKAGRNEFRFTGRVRGRRLALGVYRFAIGGSGQRQTHSRRFTVLP